MASGTLEARVAALELQVKHFQAQLAQLTAPKEAKIGRGKHANLTHAEVVANHPDYVVFLHTNGHLDKFGFTEHDYEVCKDRVPEPNTPPW